MFPRIVLASTSPWRLAMLRDAGIACEGVAPTVDEATIADPDPARLAELRAVAKARSIAGDCVVGADQVAHLDGVAFGKPLGPEDHRTRLRQLRGRAHVLTTGVCVRLHGVEHVFREHTSLHFRADVTDAEIAAYVDTREGSGCAGGYAAEGMGAQLIERIDGDFFNVIGLPLLRLIGTLRALGWRPHFPARAG
ncbi:MAG: Maf family protein [Myxococcota bacterium]